MKSNLENILSDKSISVHGLIDIDDFGLYNSKYGFEQGNKLLEKVEYYVNHHFKADYWCRIDSDEFIFSSKEINSKILKKNIFELMQIINTDLSITVSIGLTFTSQAQNSSLILSRLKTNVLLAKKYGKNLLFEL